MCRRQPPAPGLPGRLDGAGRTAGERAGGAASSGLAGALALGLLLLPSPTPAAPPEPCPGGLFVVDGALGSGDGDDRVTLRDGQLGLGGLCPAIAARVRAKRKATRITATWPGCDAFPGRLTLKAKIAAPDCRTMRGVLRTRKATPRRRRFTATRPERGVELVATLFDADVQLRMVNENFPQLIRPAAEALNPEVSELIALGGAALDAILPELARPASLVDETPVSHLAYALERIGERRATPALAAWLEQNLFGGTLLAPHFVTHALAVLDGQTPLDPSFVYGVDEMLDALARAGGGGPGALTPAGAGARELQSCWKTIRVTGLDAAGATQVREVGYTVHHLDVHEQIAAETDPRRREALERLVQGWDETDRQWFGDTDYVALPGAEISVTSNCGGTVTERLVNEVARRNGFAVHLEPGTAVAADVRDLARTFGREVASLAEAEVLTTVIAHTYDDDRVAHVEIPIAREGDTLVVFSKDNQTRARTHRMPTTGPGALEYFATLLGRYDSRAFAPQYGHLRPRLWVLDPARVLDVTVDSSACPCAFRADAPLTITEPADDAVSTRTPPVRGTTAPGAHGTGALRSSSRPGPLTRPASDLFGVTGGAFETVADLDDGSNTMRAALELDDGRRACVERTLDVDQVPAFDWSAIRSASFQYRVERVRVDVEQLDGSVVEEVRDDFLHGDQVPNFNDLPIPDPTVVAASPCMTGRTAGSFATFDPAADLLRGKRTEWSAGSNSFYFTEWTVATRAASNLVDELTIESCAATGTFVTAAYTHVIANLESDFPGGPGYARFRLTGTDVCDALMNGVASVQRFLGSAAHPLATTVTKFECGTDPAKNFLEVLLHAG